MKRTFKEFLLEMPQHYPGNVTYQKDSKFTPISLRNIQSYHLLGDDGEFVYLVDQGNTTGFVFDQHDLKGDAQHALPVMRVSLRDTNIKGYKQAHYLRVREAYSQKNITTQWYKLYIGEFKGIVSDAEHLEGGKLLWKSLIKSALSNSNASVYTINTQTGEKKDIDTNTTEADIWSTDVSLKNTVIVYELNH